MDDLYDDVLVIILRLLQTRDLIAFMRVNRYYMEFFKRNIKNFDIICNNEITDKGLEYLKGVHTINLS